MKLTPLDIHHKEFRHSLRGYAEEEVDQFLDEVADEFERLFKENIDLNEKNDALQAKVNEFELQRHTINNTLMAAQRSADDIVSKANEEGASIVRDAELKAKEVIHNALSQKQKIAAELVRIKQAEEEFRARYKSLLESNLRSVAEIPLADDVDVLLGDTDAGVLGDVRVEAPVAPAVPAPALQQPTIEMPSVEPVVAPAPPTPGFVQAVSLGEMEAPELPADVSLADPLEYTLPSLDALGEREDDVDIEEID